MHPISILQMLFALAMMCMLMAMLMAVMMSRGAVWTALDRGAKR